MPDTTIRDQLAALLHNEGIYCGNCDYESGECSDCGRMLASVADAVLAAGFRPPARVITDPAELSGLPAMSVVVNTRTGTAWQRTDYLSWISKNGLLDSRDLFRAPGRLVLIHVPEEAPDGE